VFLARTTKGAELHPSDKEICYYLGFAQGLVGNDKQSIKSLNKVLEMDPKYGDAYNLLGYAYSRLYEHEKAISAIKKYIALQPDIKNSYDSGFEIYFMAGRYDEAYKVCEDALRINPEWIQFIQYQSYIFLFRGESDKAYALIYDQIKHYPSQERILSNDLGCFYMYEGRNGDAKVEFQKVIRVTQKNKNAKKEISPHLNLGRIYTMNNEIAMAHQEFSAAKQLSVDVYGSSYNTWPIRADYYSGVAYILQGDFNEAKEMAEKIKKFIEGNLYDEILMDYYYLLLAEIHIKKSEPTKALKMINMVSGITRTQNPRCCRLMAEIFILQGEYDSALQKYQELNTDWTKNHYYNFFEYFQERSMINYRIAKIYKKKGDRQQAILYYQKALDQWKNANEDMTEFVDTQVKLAILLEKD
jgi:tetratricopeptide (TPR) repeat protein